MSQRCDCLLLPAGEGRDKTTLLWDRSLTDMFGNRWLTNGNSSYQYGRAMIQFEGSSLLSASTLLTTVTRCARLPVMPWSGLTIIHCSSPRESVAALDLRGCAHHWLVQHAPAALSTVYDSCRNATKGSTRIFVRDTTAFSAGDMIRLVQVRV